MQLAVSYLEEDNTEVMLSKNVAQFKEKRDLLNNPLYVLTHMIITLHIAQDNLIPSLTHIYNPLKKLLIPLNTSRILRPYLVCQIYCTQ